MIVFLDDSFMDVDLSVNKVARVGIETIALSVGRGEHYLLANRPLVARLIADTNLTEHARGVIAALKSDYSFLFGVLNQFKFRVNVSAVESNTARVSEFCWVVPIASFVTNGLGEGVLLAENSDDGDTYIHAAKHYQVHERIAGIQIRIAPRNGNGAGVAKEFKRIIRDKKEFCLCITDSDRLHPASDYGDNGSACRRVVKNASWVAHHNAPQGREIENALPIKITRAAAEKANPSQCEIWNDRTEILGDEPSLYADLKYGTTLRSVFSLPETGKARAYWMGVCAKLSHVKGSACFEERRCEKEDKCSCSILPGLGESIATHAREILETESAHASYRMSKVSSNFADWLRLGRDVFEIAAAPKPMRL